MGNGVGGHYASLGAFLEDASLSEGQKRRLRLFQTVEVGVCARIERMCATSGLEVTDVAVLLLSPATALVDAGEAMSGASVVIGHRDRIHEVLHLLLPPPGDEPFDPYADLLEPAPPRCVRVLIVDDESLTVMSYGTFVTVRLDPATMPRA